MNTERRVLLVSRWLLVGTSLLLVAISVPMILGRVEPNSVYGFRTAATLSDRHVWFAAITFMGYAITTGAALSAAVISLRPSFHASWLLYTLFELAR